MRPCEEVIDVSHDIEGGPFGSFTEFGGLLDAILAETAVTQFAEVTDDSFHKNG